MPTAFISYSWESDEHRDWVRGFATDLRARGIDVWLDQWELQLGDDVTQFMEHGVSEADYVLLVCTESFASKANGRQRGVGYEQAIVTAELLNSQQARGRFVCVLRSGTPSVAIPRYMQARLWVDLRDTQLYAGGLDQLTVHLLRRYEDRKPPLVLAKPVGVRAIDALPAPAVPMRGWVLVAGTGKVSAFTPGVLELSRHLGDGLAKAGYGLVTGGWPGVDEAVARAFSEATSDLGLALEDRLVQVVVKTQEPAFAAGRLVFVDSGDDEWTEPIRLASTVMLIGGVGGTRTTGEKALALRTTVLPIADSGGDAKDLYLHMLRNWEEFNWMNITQSEFQRLARQGPAGVTAAVELLAKVQAPAAD